MKKLFEDIYAVGVPHWDRKDFDALIPLPWGTSYNAYLVKGKEKTALIDTVDPEKSDELMRNLQKHSAGKIDYIISNHAEQDHSGSLPVVLKNYPEAIVLTTPRGAGMLQDFHLIQSDKIRTVEDREKIDLGGLSLQFFHLPWVHWPETMVSFLPERGILFSCDLFGSHLASSGLFASREPLTLQAALLYYAQIMMPFARHIRKHLGVIREISPKIIAPSHGPIWDNPDIILDQYSNWTGENYDNKVVIPYVSMHGSTEVMVGRFLEFLQEEGMHVKPFNMATADSGDFIAALVNTPTLIAASPMVLDGLHPVIVGALYVVNILKPNLRYAGIIGSLGWGGNLSRPLSGFLSALKVEFLEGVQTKGMPGEETLKDLKNLAGKIASLHSQMGLK